MDERDLILKLTNDFASGWTEFEMGLSDYHRMNTSQQLKVKLMMVDNIVWQILQTSASSKARYNGIDAAAVTPEHLYQSIDRVAARLGRATGTMPTHSNLALAPTLHSHTRAAPSPRGYSPLAPSSPQPTNYSYMSPAHSAAAHETCACGGTLVSQVSYAKGQYSLCTSCGQMSTRLDPNRTTNVSPQRYYPQQPPQAPPPQAAGMANHPPTNSPVYTPGYAESRSATSTPVYTPLATSVPPGPPPQSAYAPANSSNATPPSFTPNTVPAPQPTTPRRYEVRTPAHRSYEVTERPPITSDEVVPSNDPVFSVRQVPSSRSKQAKKQQKKGSTEATPLRSVKENRDKFDFNKVKPRDDSDAEEMQVGRHPSSSSPVDRRPIGEGWGKEDGQWKQWCEMQNRGNPDRRDSVREERAEPKERRDSVREARPEPKPVKRRESVASVREETRSRRSDVSLVAVNVAPAAPAPTASVPPVPVPPPPPSDGNRSAAQTPRSNVTPMPSAASVGRASAASQHSVVEPAQRAPSTPVEEVRKCSIEVRSLDGRTLSLPPLPVNMPIRELKTKIAVAWGGTVEYMRIVHNGKAWDNASTLADMGLSLGGVVHVVMPS
eukprot:TRINITY_DN11529_c0_g1_i2.p1 TRINITY_DN11529_c0_g1~~TRINITY_DN11529_c0_g1_i2.p1  ORF type:complete len:619 (+),score=79.73 TRINITY_DN11529_c0_g1_i2:37-1857(+)